MAALTRRGVAVAPFKVGPDYIDPGHHAAACGRVSRNLDGWMCGEEAVRESFGCGCAHTDVAVIEGVMGLFDGASGDSDEGSTAEISAWLGGRILLVVDARSQARSAAALVKGFVEFNPWLNFAGIIFNRIGSPRHEQLLREAVASTPGLPPLLGCLPRAAEIAMPERHLGLVTAGADASIYARMADLVEAHLNLDQLLEGWGQAWTVDKCLDCPGLTPKVRIGVARDEAFCFCYPENLERLEQAGAELVFFSPLSERLPADIDGLYLPGGYPELHAVRLAGNQELLSELKRQAEAGLPIYAECGGLMLLAESIDGQPMAGVFPGPARLLDRRKALGYREVRLTSDTLLGPVGMIARGHEFHYSELDLPDSIERCYRLGRKGGEQLGVEGFRVRNVLGSYVHLHFASNPYLAKNFVEFCIKNQEETRSAKPD